MKNIVSQYQLQRQSNKGDPLQDLSRSYDLEAQKA